MDILGQGNFLIAKYVDRQNNRYDTGQRKQGRNIVMSLHEKFATNDACDGNKYQHGETE
jgi:hypothetical protein